MFKSLINTVLSILLIIISTFLFSYKVKAQTGSCAANYPTIGLIEKIVENENYLDVSLSNAFQPDVSYFENKNIYEIDWYENIVKNYVQNNFSLTEPYLENSQEIKLGNQVFLPLEILKLTSLKKGDMIINGPPS